MQNARRNPRASNSLISRNGQNSIEQSSYKGRFAPSPTGPLHIGSLIAAMASYLQARKVSGSWQIRIDDVDPPREVTGATGEILDCLMSHGFHSDQPIAYQSKRSARYESALDALMTSGDIYGCACTRKSIKEYAIKNNLDKEADVYPGICRNRNLPVDEHAIRFKVHGTITFSDLIQGFQSQNLTTQIGDFILRRKNGFFSYQLVNVVDDGVDGITEIVRGADLLDNTPRQIALSRALGFKLPVYFHVPVAVNNDGQKLAKQTHAKPLQIQSRVENLLHAWNFLGQERLDLFTGDTSEFWDKAEQCWAPRRIPTVPKLPVEYFKS